MARNPDRRSLLRGLPGDPYAYRMAPVRSGPKSRSGAAVVEPEEETGGFFSTRR